MTDTERTRRRGVFRLIADLPKLVVDLFRAELESFRNELVGKLKAAGIGIGLFVGAALFAFFALAVFIAAAVLGLATALPAWASALIIGGVLLVIAVVLALLGLSNLRRGIPPVPAETIASVKQDVNTIRGIGKRG